MLMICSRVERDLLKARGVVLQFKPLRSPTHCMESRIAWNNSVLFKKERKSILLVWFLFSVVLLGYLMVLGGGEFRFLSVAFIKRSQRGPPPPLPQLTPSYLESGISLKIELVTRPTSHKFTVV